MTLNDDTAPSSAELAATIISAYLTNNTVAREELPGLIAAVSGALKAAAAGANKPAEPEPLVPAVPIRKSITDDYIVCLEDGKRFKSLRRHLMTRYGMTPDAYRQKWGLSSDYPMVAPNYAAARSALAKNSGLGRKPAAAPEPAPQAAPEPVAAAPEPAETEAKAPKRRAPRRAKETA